MPQLSRVIRKYAGQLSALEPHLLNLPTTTRLLLALLLVAAATAIRWAVFPQVRGFEFLTYYPAVVLSAMLLGPGPALLAVPVSATLATWFLIVQNHTLHRVEDASLAIFIFVLSSAIVVYLAYSAQRNLRLARRAGLKLASVHEASHFGLVLSDASGRFLEFNETFARLTGYTPSELHALDYLALTPKQYLAEEEQQVAVLNSTGHYGPFEKEYIRKDGTLVAVQVQGAFYRDPDGDRVLCSVVEDNSGRRQAQAKIKQLADEQRAMIENPAAGIIKLTDRRMIWVNDTFATMLGYRAEDLIGQSTRCLYPSDDAFRAFEADGYAKIEAHGSANLEVEFRHRNGSPVFLKCGMARLNGSQNTYVGVFSDLTEQHAAQRSLERAKARLQDAQRLAQIGSWEMDHTTGRLSWSEEMFALYGVPPTTSAPPDHTHLQNLHPADRPMTEDAFSSALDSGCPLDFTHRVILPNHTIIYVHVKAETTYTPGGAPLVTIGTAQDVTKNVRQENALRLSEQRVRTVFAAMREGLVVQQRDGRIVQANDSAARLLGVTTDQLLGQNSIDPRSDALRDDDSSFPAENHPWTVAMQTGQPALEVTMGVRLPAGKVRWLSVDAHPLMNSGSSDAEAVVVTFTDITERRQRDGEVRRLAFYDELTSLPTRHLLEDRLSQALAATKRNKEFMALMMLDLDNFKPLNDCHGHLVGDLLLKECAARLSRSVRAADTVARFGGDEFVVVLNDLGRDEADAVETACQIAEQLRASVAQPFMLNAEQAGGSGATIEHRCTASIGIVIIGGGDVSSAALLRQADDAMYQAKRNGRNRVRVVGASVADLAAATS